MSATVQTATSTTGSAVAHTAVAENVAVKSVVSTETQSKVSLENTQKMAALMSKLGNIIFNRTYRLSYSHLFIFRYNSSTNWWVFSPSYRTNLRRSCRSYQSNCCWNSNSTTNSLSRCQRSFSCRRGRIQTQITKVRRRTRCCQSSKLSNARKRLELTSRNDSRRSSQTHRWIEWRS